MAKATGMGMGQGGWAMGINDGPWDGLWGWSRAGRKAKASEGRPTQGPWMDGQGGEGRSRMDGLGGTASEGRPSRRTDGLGKDRGWTAWEGRPLRDGLGWKGRPRRDGQGNDVGWIAKGGRPRRGGLVGTAYSDGRPTQRRGMDGRGETVEEGRSTTSGAASTSYGVGVARVPGLRRMDGLGEPAEGWMA